ncbi:MAG: GNAT family N-acetyltransferase [Steroidobacter sp.]
MQERLPARTHFFHWSLRRPPRIFVRMSPTLQFIPVRTAEQLATVAELAHEIWYEYYVPLIGRAQVDYMVAKFQNVAAMQSQIDHGYEYFLVRREDTPGKGAQDVGYCAVQEQADGALFLSKFYLQKSARGSGTGRGCMEFIEGLARRRGLSLLWLTVNKGNPAVQAYQRLGFRIAADLVMDIGGGFVMDDYRMEKPLTSAGATAIPGM